MHRSHSVIILAAALTVLVGCDNTNPAHPGAQPATLRAIASNVELMHLLIDPAADVVWDSAGFVITAAGETDLSPSDDNAWAKVADAALLVAESGNLLMLEGRSAGTAWDGFSRQLITAGTAAATAAINQNADALFDAGGKIYQACRTCHDVYMLPMRERRLAQ